MKSVLVVFLAYSVFILAGLALYLAIGMTHR